MKQIFLLTLAISLIIGMGFTACFDDDASIPTEVIESYCAAYSVPCRGLNQNQTECIESITDSFNSYPDDCYDEFEAYLQCGSEIVDCGEDIAVACSTEDQAYSSCVKGK